MTSENTLLTKIQSEWKKDSKMDIDHLDQESMEIPQLHSKYYDNYIILKELKITKEADKRKLKLALYDHYSGRNIMPGKDSAFKRITGVDNINRNIEADEDMISIVSQIEYITMVMDYLVDILKMIHNRTFQIKHAIDYQKFQSGIDI